MLHFVSKVKPIYRTHEDFKSVRFTRSLPGLVFFPKSVVIKENPTRKSSLSHFNKLTYNCNKFIDFDRFTTWGTYIYNIEADEIYM